MKLSSEIVCASSRKEEKFNAIDHPRLKNLSYTGNDVYLSECRGVYLVQFRDRKIIYTSIEELKKLGGYR